MNGYGPQKSLMEILEDLGNYCFQNLGNPNQIKVILPKIVLDQFSRVYASKERFKLSEEELSEPKTISKVMSSFSGVIELFNADDNEVTTKDKS